MKEGIMSELIPAEEAAPSFSRTVINENADQEAPSREWQAIRGECRSGGLLDETCSLVAAGEGKVKLDIVQYRLACGCILVLSDADEIML